MTCPSAARALQVYRRLPERPHRLVILTLLTTVSAAPTLPTALEGSQEDAMHTDVGPGGHASGARSVGKIFDRLAESTRRLAGRRIAHTCAYARRPRPSARGLRDDHADGRSRSVLRRRGRAQRRHHASRVRALGREFLSDNGERQADSPRRRARAGRGPATRLLGGRSYMGAQHEQHEQRRPFAASPRIQLDTT